VNWTPDIALEPILEGIPVGAAASNYDLVDDVAEFLLQHLEDRQLTKENVSEVLAYLARTRGGRYRLVMEQVNASKRLVMLADVARKYLREYKYTTAEQYVPGSRDFAALRERSVQQALLPQPTEERARAFDTLRSGDSLEKIFALLGPPQRVETRYFRVNDTVNLRRLVLYYRGAGRATFSLDDKTGWGFQASVADPLAFEMLMPYRARAGEFGLPDDEHIRMAQLTSGGAPAARAALESAYRLPNVSLDFLDATAELLSRQWPDAKDEGVEDNCGWMLRLLRTKGGVRYAPLFLEIQKKSHSLKLKKWSKLTLLKYPDFLPGSYVVGSVPLEEWARRYPSPYPGVTYTNGRLRAPGVR
jgi:mRNA-degrading endonuclease RelE of RelBE toxin-antitoxin system